MSSATTLPRYAALDLRQELESAGATGTVYALIMPETEEALAAVVDGRLGATGGEPGPSAAQLRERHYFSRYREPWTRRQDAAHEDYFEAWLAWSRPVLGSSLAAFAHRYPTAGASEGIYKLMAEYAAESQAADREPVIETFEGEYEGFRAYAEALLIRCVAHPRSAWRDLPERLTPGAQFWVSQPSAIDGMVWPDFPAFAALLAERRPDVQLLPDLTYLGCVARPYRIALDLANVPAVVMSQSKPFGGYYQRVGGVLARDEVPSLFGNKWFKNLQSLAWANEMMRRHDVFALPWRYRRVQERAAEIVAARLGIEDLRPADVSLLATAPAREARTASLRAVLRGEPGKERVRLCLTPMMSRLIAPYLAPSVALGLPEAVAC